MTEVSSTRQPSGTPPSGRVHHLFEVQAARTPDACAVVVEGEATVTYRELDRRANRFAHRLRGLGVGPEMIVGICLERSIGGMISLLAVLKAGGAYLPLDPAYPAERLAYMLENARAFLLITEPESRPPADAPGCRQISYREHAATSAATVELDDVPPNDPAGPLADPLAYVIYTSGSTGQPKGVAMAHGALCNLLCWQARACPLAAGSAVLQFAPLSFDVSFQEVFSTLGAGGTLVLVPEAVRRDPRGLLRQMDEQNIARVFLPPVMLGQLAEHSAAGGALPHGLREVIAAGEALRITPAVAAFFTALRTRNGRCSLHNHYGPTETHVATAYTLPGEPAAWPALPAIGQPIDGAKVRLLDEDGHPVVSGEPGTLHLGGDCLARGYLHDAGLTDAKFVRDARGARWYRTGDLARVLPDGNLQFLGRSDEQLKIHGFRVELGEVEAALSRHPAIREVAVCARSGHAADDSQELLACFVPRDPARTPSPGDLRQWMLCQVPGYLVPAYFSSVERLPLTPSGKVDRRALSLRQASFPEPASVPAVPPRTSLEKLIARTWEEVLGRPQPGVRDVFFEVGGTSLHAMRVHTKLCRELQREFPITALFQHPTIEALAVHLEADSRAADPSAAVLERARRQQQQQQPSTVSAAALAARARLAGATGRHPR